MWKTQDKNKKFRSAWNGEGSDQIILWIFDKVYHTRDPKYPSEMFRMCGDIKGVL